MYSKRLSEVSQKKHHQVETESLNILVEPLLLSMNSLYSLKKKKMSGDKKTLKRGDMSEIKKVHQSTKVERV